MVGVFGVVGLACDLGGGACAHKRLKRGGQAIWHSIACISVQSPNENPAPELGILVAVVTGNFLHEHHDPAPHGGIINSHERSDQP